MSGECVLTQIIILYRILTRHIVQLFPLNPCILSLNVEDFSIKRKDAYKYELLGGQHTALARKAVLKQHPRNHHFQQVLSEVYVGLTDDEALRLASRHNSNGHIGMYRCS